MLALGAVLSVVGLAIAGTSPVVASTGAQPLAGGLAVLAGWALLAFGVHRFGRESR